MPMQRLDPKTKESHTVSVRLPLSLKATFYSNVPLRERSNWLRKVIGAAVARLDKPKRNGKARR